MYVSLIAGARPNFMKIAPLVRALKAIDLQPRLIHTGQHYDEKMSETFFRELHIPEPDVNLGVGSGTHVWQIGEIMQRLGSEYERSRPGIVVVVGDVNSTLAAALTATKMGIPVAHVEAGLRSYDQTMPEEINRVVTDSMSDLLFISEPSAERNLLREGIHSEKVFSVGNVMIDTLQSYLDNAQSLKLYEQFEVKKASYAVLTLHRPSNVDDSARLESILKAVQYVGRRMPVIFPVHPRTKQRLLDFGFEKRPELDAVTMIEPQGYVAMLSLMDSARLVLTDSGGIQEESTALRVPCLTIRENTERPITIEIGSNELVGWETEAITSAVDTVLDGPLRIGTVPENWDGRAAIRIAATLQSYLSSLDTNSGAIVS